MIKKTVNLFVLFLFLSSIFVIAQETDDEETVVEECGIGCKVWQFLFGSKEARAGKAWFDRSEALVGEAAEIQEKLEEANKETKVQLKEGDQVVSQPKIDSTIKGKVGASYSTLEESVGKVKSVYEVDPGKTTGQFVIQGSGGEVRVDKKANEEGVRTARRFANDKIVESYVIVDGQIVAAQKTDGTIKVGDSSYTFPKGKSITSADSLASLKEGIQLPGKEGEPSGFLQLDKGILTAVNYEEETFQRITATGTETGKADYYSEGVSGCATKGGCWVPTGGEITFTDADGKSQTYLTDYEYEGTGADRKKEQIELFDLRTGRKNGIVLVDEKGETDTIITKSGKKTEQGEPIYEVKDAKTGTTIEAMKVNDNWRSVSSPTNPRLQELTDEKEIIAQTLADTQLRIEVVSTEENKLALEYSKEADEEKKKRITDQFKKVNAEGYTLAVKKEELGKELSKVNEEIIKEENLAKKAEDDLSNKLNKDETAEALEELETEETLAGISSAIQSIYSISNNLKSYPAISNLLFGEADFYKSWRSDMDRAFAPLLAETWFTSAICEEGANHWQDIEPEGKAVIKTASGTYQAVASIQMERSPEASPILCHKNPDEESDELFICDSRQVCVDDNFCYADQDRDNEADSDGPLKGYFYKVTWAVSSPQDEALTPLVDENGVAVSFNVFLYPGAVPMYNLNGNIASPIQLQNGASDRDAIIKYSINVYDQACIRWNQAPRTVRFVPGGEDVEDVCFNVVTSSVGKVNWERSGQDAASVTVSHGEINRNTDW